MRYPKKVMNRKELMKECGFSETYLMRAFTTPGQTFAWRDNPANRTSPIMFDTEGLEEWRIKDIQMQQRAIRQKGGAAGCV